MGDASHDADHHLVGFRHVGSDEFDTGLLQAKQEVRIAAQTIELGDRQRRAIGPASPNCLGKRRTVITLAAFNFGEAGLDLPIATIEEVLDRLALGFEAEPAGTLPCGGHPEVCDEFALGHSALASLSTLVERKAIEYFDECKGALARLLGKLQPGRVTGGRQPAAQRMGAGTRKQNGATRDRGPRLAESRLPGTARRPSDCSYGVA